MAFNQSYQPEQNAGLGLIFRLNALWEKADRRALSGDNDAWELILDRIFSNLMYREEMEVKINSHGEIVSLDITEKTMKEWDFLKQKISEAKHQIRVAAQKKSIRELHLANTNHYWAIVKYDIWLRKFMQSLGGLYLKESESNPSRALFGSAFGKKGR
jgi:hypothetical protein